MELRASSASASGLKACLVAARYAGVTIATVIDSTAEELVLSGSGKEEVRGRSAILRCVNVVHRRDEE